MPAETSPDSSAHDSDAGGWNVWLRFVLRASAIAAGALILYVLSPGPLFAALHHISKDREWDDEWLQKLYAPISWANNHSPAFRKCMATYLAFWDSSPGE